MNAQKGRRRDPQRYRARLHQGRSGELGGLLKAGSFAAAREEAQVRLEGKEYIVQDGDVILFRHSG